MSASNHDQLIRLVKGIEDGTYEPYAEEGEQGYDPEWQEEINELNDLMNPPRGYTAYPGEQIIALLLLAEMNSYGILYVSDIKDALIEFFLGSYGRESAAHEAIFDDYVKDNVETGNFFGTAFGKQVRQFLGINQLVDTPEFSSYYTVEYEGDYYVFRY